MNFWNILGIEEYYEKHLARLLKRGLNENPQYTLVYVILRMQVWFVFLNYIV